MNRRVILKLEHFNIINTDGPFIQIKGVNSYKEEHEIWEVRYLVKGFGKSYIDKAHYYLPYFTLCIY